MKPHILFVDDEAPVRELLSIFFKKRGYAVTSVTTREEAMELVEQVPFNLAILDIDLAGENGLELLVVFKAKYPVMPVIMFTGMGYDQGLLAEAMGKGADDFMSKTDSLDDLLRSVQRTLAK